MHDKPVAAGKSSFDLIDREKALALMAVRPGSSFLDLACGVGRYSVAVAENIGAAGSVYAVDLWCEGLGILEREIGDKGLRNIKAICADIRTPLPLAGDSIDACLAATILHDLPGNDRKATVREIVRLLKADGLLHVIEFKKIDKGPGPPISIRLDEDDLEALVEPFGFHKVAAADVGKFNYMVAFRKALS